MADISKLNIDNTEYNIKDAAARTDIANLKSAVTGGMHYIGVTSTSLTDGATTTTLAQAKTGDMSKLTGFESGDIVIFGTKEFIFTSTGNGTGSWHEFGSTGSLKGLAFKDSASGTVASHTHTISQEAAASCTMTQGDVSASGKFTPAGSVSISKGTGTANYTPEGSVTHSVKSTDVALGEATTFTNAASAVSLTGGDSASLELTEVNSVTDVGSTPSLSYTKKSIPNVTSVGSAPTLGTAISADDITSWSAGTMFAASVDGETLKFTSGTKPALSYTARTIPNVTSVGSAPTLGTAIDAHEITAWSEGSTPSYGGVVVATGGVTSGEGSGVGATVVTELPSGGTAAAQKITVGTNDKVTAITAMNSPSFSGTGVKLQASFTGTEGSVSVTGKTSGVAATVPAHNHGGATGATAPSVTVS